MTHGHGNHHHKKKKDHGEEEHDADIMPPPPTPAPDAPATPSQAAPAAPTVPTLAPNAGVLARYEHWVLTHTSRARNLETALYFVPQLVPKNYKDPEVASQTSYAMVGLLGLYHDYIQYKTAHKGDNSDVFTRLLRVPLSLVSHVQVIAEVTARKFGGEVSRWRLIVWVELFKSACKVLLLLQQRRGLLIGAGKYKTIHPPGTKKSPFARFSKSKPGSRTGKVFGGNKTKTVEDVSEEPTAPGPTTLTFDDPTFVAAEVQREQLLLGGELLHIFRPVAYALLRQRKGEESWLPAIVSILIEASGLVLSSSSFEKEGLSPSIKAVQSKKAQEELASRKMAMLLYLMRDPVYASVTKPATEKLCGVTDYVPVFGKFFRLVSVGILDYYHKYHFYTAAS